MSEIKEPGAVLADRHQPGDLRQGLGLGDALQLALHVDQAAVALLLIHRQLRIGLLLARLDIGLELSQRPLALLLHEKVLLAVDRVDDGVPLNFQLRAPHVVPCLEQGYRVIARLDRQVRLQFLDLLVHGLHRQLRLFQRRQALGIVVFDDQVLLVR